MMTPTSHGIREGSKANTSDEAKVKEREKGKGKGKRQRRDEDSSDQEKEKAEEKEERKGRSHMVSEEGYEDEWQDDEWNENYDGYWADDQTWNEGYWAYDDSYYMDEYGYFQRKGKGKGKGKKGKKGKDDDGKGGKPGDGKGKSKLCSTSDHISSCHTESTKLNKLIILLQLQVLVMVSFHLEQLNQHVLMLQRTEPARVDVLTSTYSAQDEQRRTRRGGQKPT